MVVVAADHRLGVPETPTTSLRDFSEKELLGLIPDTQLAKMVACY